LRRKKIKAPQMQVIINLGILPIKEACLMSKGDFMEHVFVMTTLALATVAVFYFKTKLTPRPVRVPKNRY
jgi:hypothetical protein